MGLPMRRVVIPTGTVLLHGTAKRYAGLPPGPAWYTDLPEVTYIGARENMFLPRERRWKPLRVIAVAAIAPLTLAGLDSVAVDYHAFASGDYFNRREFDRRGDLAAFIHEVGFRPAGVAGEDQAGLARAACEAGFDGWILRDIYDPGDDILICRPAESLETVKEWTVRLDDKESRNSFLRSARSLMRRAGLYAT